MQLQINLKKTLKYTYIITISIKTKSSEQIFFFSVKIALFMEKK